MKSLTIAAECVGTNSLALVTAYGTMALPFIAIIAAAIAIWQIRSNVAVVRKATAYNIYQQYLKLALDHPVLAYGKQDEINENPEVSGQYKWFVANMLFSFEEILLTCNNENDWKATISSQLRRHAWHLSTSSSVKNRHWKRELKTLIDSAVEANKS